MNFDALWVLLRSFEEKIRIYILVSLSCVGFVNAEFHP